MSKSVPHVFFQEFYDLKSYIYVFIPLLVLFWCEFIMGGLLSIIFKTRPHDFCSLHCREAHGHTYNKRVWKKKSNFTSREKEKKKVVLLSTQNLYFSQYLIFKSESFYLILFFFNFSAPNENKSCHHYSRSRTPPFIHHNQNINCDIFMDIFYPKSKTDCTSSIAVC